MLHMPPISTNNYKFPNISEESINDPLCFRSIYDVLLNLGLFCFPPFFIHSGYFYASSSSSLSLKGAPYTARIMGRSFTPKRHRQLRVKVLPKVPTWRLQGDSNPRPFGRNATNLKVSHHVPQPCVNASF